MTLLKKPIINKLIKSLTLNGYVCLEATINKINTAEAMDTRRKTIVIGFRY